MPPEERLGQLEQENRELRVAMPLVSTLTLGLLMSGTMYEEQRELNGPWKGQYLRQGDLFLRPAGRAPYELRWQAISSTQLLSSLALHF
jgi:hypothetical protein